MIKRFFIFIFFIEILSIVSCARKPPVQSQYVNKTESDDSLSYVAVVFSNSKKVPLTVKLERKNLKPKIYIIPPLSEYRMIIAPGTWKMIILETKKTSILHTVSHFRYYINL